MNRSTDPVWLDAVDQAESVRTGAVAAGERLRRSLEQVDFCEPSLNCLVGDRRARVFEELEHVPTTAPFRGVPALIKDLSCGVAGESMWNGNRALRRLDFRAPHDSLVVRRLRAAGFAIVGRTNTAEFGATITTEPSATGSTRNPWDPKLTAGGSSGGSAAAVAAGYAPVAHGTDASGSIRIPASACGVLGLKPTNGSIPLDPQERDGWFGLSTPGILARSSRDLSAVFALLRAETAHVEPELPTIGGPRLRIGVLNTAGLPVQSEISLALSHTARMFEELGHAVRFVSPAFLSDPDLHRHFLTLVSAGLASEVQAWEQRLGVALQAADLERSTLALLKVSKNRSAADLEQAGSWRRHYQESVEAWWAGGRDVLVTPVLARAHAPIGWFTDPDAGGRRVREAMRFTAQFNVAGNPAISVPLHQTSIGLPLGIQFVARRGGDEVLLALVRELEAAGKLSIRHPELNSLIPGRGHLGVRSEKGGNPRCGNG